MIVMIASGKFFFHSRQMSWFEIPNTHLSADFSNLVLQKNYGVYLILNSVGSLLSVQNANQAFSKESQEKFFSLLWILTWCQLLEKTSCISAIVAFEDNKRRITDHMIWDELTPMCRIFKLWNLPWASQFELFEFCTKVNCKKLFGPACGAIIGGDFEN